MIEIAGVKYNNDGDRDIDKIISEYEDADYRDPIEAILSDMDIDIFRKAAMQHVYDAQLEGWTPPHYCEEDNILGCIEQVFAGADAKDCLKSMDLDIYDILEDPKEYKYLVTSRKHV